MSDPGVGLIGSWKLVSAEDLDPQTKRWIPNTFGNPPCGLFVYDGNGNASVPIMTTPPTSIASPDTPTPDEALGIFNGYDHRRSGHLQAYADDGRRPRERSGVDNRLWPDQTGACARVATACLAVLR